MTSSIENYDYFVMLLLHMFYQNKNSLCKSKTNQNIHLFVFSQFDSLTLTEFSTNTLLSNVKQCLRSRTYNF